MGSPVPRYTQSAPPDVTFPLRYELSSYTLISLGECYTRGITNPQALIASCSGPPSGVMLTRAKGIINPHALIALSVPSPSCIQRVVVFVFVAYRAYIGGTSAPQGSMKELKHS